MYIWPEAAPKTASNMLNKATNENELKVVGHMQGGLLGPFNAPKIVTGGCQKRPKAMIFGPIFLCAKENFFGHFWGSLGDAFWGIR